jgi:hypothetical protein
VLSSSAEGCRCHTRVTPPPLPRPRRTAQEAAISGALANFAHHGMIFVPIGCRFIAAALLALSIPGFSSRYERRRTRHPNKSASVKLQRRVIAHKSVERHAAAPFHLLDKVLQASLYISVLQCAEVAVLLPVVLSFTTVFLFCLRRLDNIGAT